jgi:ABC-type dipeptide/oligopeptide/nickel transport system ATPase subunit
MAPKKRSQEPICFRFEDLAVTHSSKKKKRVIIDHISGIVKEGNVTVVLGPSGAGQASICLFANVVLLECLPLVNRLLFF